MVPAWKMIIITIHKPVSGEFSFTWSTHWGLWSPHILQHILVSSPLQDPHRLQLELLKSPTSESLTIILSLKYFQADLEHCSNRDSLILIPHRHLLLISSNIWSAFPKEVSLFSFCWVLGKWLRISQITFWSFHSGRLVRTTEQGDASLLIILIHNKTPWPMNLGEINSQSWTSSSWLAT